MSENNNHQQQPQKSSSSEKRIAANRKNALRSTGPNDTSITRFNALKHGLTAQRIVVTSLESEEEYRHLIESLQEDFRPETSLEEILIGKIASALWRLQRIVRAEKAGIEDSISRSLLARSLERPEAIRHLEPYRGPAFIRHESMLERKFYRALFILLQIQRNRNNNQTNQETIPTPSPNLLNTPTPQPLQTETNTQQDAGTPEGPSTPSPPH